MLILPSISYTVIGTGTRSRYHISTILFKIMLSIWGAYELFSTFFMLTLQLVFIRAGYLRHDSRNASRRHCASSNIRLLNDQLSGDVTKICLEFPPFKRSGSPLSSHHCVSHVLTPPYSPQ